MDMFYEISIPLKNLDITATDIESNGIGIMKLSTFGTSGMDCLPYDMSMSDNAAKPYSSDSSTSMEKEDEDHLTVPMARIGKAFTPGAVTPTNPPKPTEAPTDPPKPTEAPTDPPVQPTDPPVPTQAPTEAPPAPAVLLGDADDDGIVSIFDVTKIQRYLSGVPVPKFNAAAADVDGDDEVTIRDATFIQRAIAGIAIPYNIIVE